MESVTSNVNASILDLLQDLETRFNQTEHIVTIEVGVALGLISSFAISVVLWASSRIAARTTDGPLDFVKTKIKDDRIVLTPSMDMQADEAENGNAVGKDSTAPPSVANTEGAYRSDSESDDEGAKDRLSKTAQRRSRSSAGV